jgi:hypothetical protein
MSALWNTAAWRGRDSERITLDDGDPLVRITQHACREQSGHSRAEDHRVPTDRLHHAPTSRVN